MLWDRTRDEFKLGQWLKGRIYERRSDLSPDGKYLLYFAAKHIPVSEAGCSWTAISRAPYLKAIAIFPKGDCWHGGGLWTGDSTYWLNDGYGHKVLRNSTDVRRDDEYIPEGFYGYEDRSVYYPRLIRDGWKLVRLDSRSQSYGVDIFDKPIAAGWTLRKLSPARVGVSVGKGCNWDEHQLIRRRTGEVIECPTWEWADLDGPRLVWATEGKLFSGSMLAEGLANETQLFDFSGMQFSPIQAPY